MMDKIEEMRDIAINGPKRKRCNIKLGDEVKDVVTGFKGIATSRLEALSGKIEIAVTPKHKHTEEKRPIASWVDLEYLERVGDGVHVEPIATPMGFRSVITET